MSKSGTTAKALGEPCKNSPATKNGKEILYQEHADTDLNCCELCRNKFNAKTSVHKMKLLIRPGYENGCCEMLGCTDKGVAHKYRVYPDYGPNIVACFDNNIAVPIHILQGPQNGVIYIDCFQNDRPFCRTTDEKGWTCEIINDDPLDKNFYFNGTRLKVLTPENNGYSTSTKRKADEEATDTEDDSDRDTKRIKKSNLTRMNADSKMYGLLKCNVEAREKKQEECGTVGDIDLLHLCYGCKQDALNEKAFELSCYPFPFDDNEYKYYVCEREGCRTAENGCGNLVTRA
jgi:hypothetical protein